jgi:hypothetical protein
MLLLLEQGMDSNMETCYISANRNAKLIRVLPILVFGLLMVLKIGMIWSTRPTGPVGGDERDYVSIAKSLWTNHRFISAKIYQWDTDNGRSLAFMSHRLPGYPVLIYPFFLMGPRDENLRSGVVPFHILLDLLVASLLLYLGYLFTPSLPCRVLMAAILGLQPWTSAFVFLILTETAMTFMMVAGVLFLSWFTAPDKKHRPLWLVLGSSALSYAFCIRAEMIVSVAVLIFISLLLAKSSMKTFLFYGLLASIPFVAGIGANVYYRYKVFGEVAPLENVNNIWAGPATWGKTWYGSGMLKENTGQAISRVTLTQSDLPKSAFDNDEERRRFEQIMGEARITGHLTSKGYNMFEELGRERIARNPLRYYVFVRVYNAVSLWVNLETGEYVPQWFSRLPRLLSKMGVGFFLALRVLIMFFGIIGSFKLYQGRRAKRNWQWSFLWLGMCFAGVQTLLLGIYLSTAVPRYVAPAWPFLLALSFYGMSKVLGGKVNAAKLSESQ